MTLYIHQKTMHEYIKSIRHVISLQQGFLNEEVEYSWGQRPPTSTVLLLGEGDSQYLEDSITLNFVFEITPLDDIFSLTTLTPENFLFSTKGISDRFLKRAEGVKETAGAFGFRNISFSSSTFISNTPLSPSTPSLGFTSDVIIAITTEYRK